MWITTVTYDMLAIRELNEIESNIMSESIRLKKRELQGVDGTSEYPVVTEFDNYKHEHATVILKKTWNQKINAQAFVDYLANFSHITATLEEA